MQVSAGLAVESVRNTSYFEKLNQFSSTNLRFEENYGKKWCVSQCKRQTFYKNILSNSFQIQRGVPQGRYLGHQIKYKMYTIKLDIGQMISKVSHSILSSENEI